MSKLAKDDKNDSAPAIYSADDVCRELSDVGRELSGSLRELSDDVREFSEGFRELADDVRELSEGFRELSVVVR